MSQLPTNHSAAPLRIGIVEDDSGFAARLIEGIQKTKDLSAVGHYVTGQAALEALASLKLQLVLVDLKLPGMGGIEFIRRTKLLWPDLVTVVLTQFDDSDLLFAALAAGADSYLLKTDTPERILNGMRDAFSGGSVMSPSIGRKVFDFFQRPVMSDAVRGVLSSREREILLLARAGKTSKQISAALGLSHETVRTHFRNIYRSLQVHSLTEALEKTFKGSFP